MTTEKSIEADVLFQKLGETWYAFSEIDGELIFSALPAGVDPRTTEVELISVMKDHLKQVAKGQRRAPEAAA